MCFYLFLCHTVPGRVVGFLVSGQDDTTFRVQWRSPVMDNGVITGYTIIVYSYSTKMEERRVETDAVNSDDSSSIVYSTILQGLGKTWL